MHMLSFNQPRVISNISLTDNCRVIGIVHHLWKREKERKAENHKRTLSIFFIYIYRVSIKKDLEGYTPENCGYLWELGEGIRIRWGSQRALYLALQFYNCQAELLSFCYRKIIFSSRRYKRRMYSYITWVIKRQNYFL